MTIIFPDSQVGGNGGASIKDRTPIQTIDIVKLVGTGLQTTRSVLVRSPAYDNWSDIVNVKYQLSCAVNVSGDVLINRLYIPFRLEGLFSFPSLFAICDKMMVTGYTTYGAGLQCYSVNPEKNNTDDMELVVTSTTEGMITGKAFIEIDFTLPNMEFDLGMPDW